MTQFIHELTLDDRERMVLEQALQMFIRQRHAQAKDEREPAYEVQALSARGILDRLRANTPWRGGPPGGGE